MTTATKATAEIRGLSKDFGETHALKPLDLTLKKGEILGVAGPDGAGKTTLIRLLAGLLKPTEGTVTVDGFDTILQAQAVHENIGYMPQRFGLYEDLSVLQNLNLYAELRGVKRNEKKETFKKLLEFTGLSPFQSRLAKDLSGGMKQKLGLACALVKRPKLLLLDEPSVGVDPLSRRELWKMVKGLIDEGVSVVWSTSYLDEAAWCDKTLLLNEGNKLYYGDPKGLIERVQGRVFSVSGIPEDKRRQMVKELLEDPNTLDGVIEGAKLRIVVKAVQDPPFDAKGYKITPINPRFEDAYVDILGVKVGGGSKIADNIEPVQPTSEYAVQADNLTKKFGTFTAASNISFSIRPGEIYGLLGPNGAGKSTTFKMLCGLLKPTEGIAYLNGRNIQTASGRIRDELGYMAQKFSLYGTLSVQQNLNYFAGIYGLSGSNKESRIQEMVDIFELKPYLTSIAQELPLGFKQRLALSCALMHSPSVLFLDEPTSGVDPLTRREFWNHINGLVRKGVTILVTTHFMEEAEYCDRIALIYKSKMIESGDPEAIKKAAATKDNPEPTLEEAFIHLIENYEETHEKT
ncbi:MAG: ABC transporter ATP-binding protein [Chlamydiia bacterium]|nr:ABC transporter ATP-binding protein [Chlamydiia bacterium]